MSFNALHPLNALIPMLFTELGIMMDSRLRQFWKARCLMEVTVLGILTDSRFLQSEYLQPIITQYFIDNKSEIWLLFLIAHSKR